MGCNAVFANLVLKMQPGWKVNKIARRNTVTSINEYNRMQQLHILLHLTDFVCVNNVCVVDKSADRSTKKRS